MGEKKAEVVDESLLAQLLRFPVGFFTLFFSRKFIVHRLWGLFYLIQYFVATWYYFADYEGFKNSHIIWILPLTGLIQSITAIYTFTFLPKKTKDGGYFGDRGTLSYAFITENSFFAMLLLFQWIYYNDKIYSFFRSTIVFENGLVFLPYMVRFLWPKTRIRDSLDNSAKNKTQGNHNFFIIVTWITKIFYVWAKHYIGYFLNYVRFLNRISEEEKYHIYLLLIFSAMATTIAVFLHTLKFRGYLNPRISFLIYQGSYLATFYGFYNVSGIFFANLDLTLLVLVGLIINFGELKYQHMYQLVVMALLNGARYNMLPEVLSGFYAVNYGTTLV